MGKEFILGTLLWCFGHRMTIALDSKGTFWVLGSISLTPKRLVCKKPRIRVLISFFLGYPGRTSCPCSLFLRERFRVHDLWHLLRLHLSKFGECPVYLIVEKQVSMWLRVQALGSDHEGSDPSSTPSKLCDFGQLIELFFLGLLWDGGNNSTYWHPVVDRIEGLEGYRH